MYKWNGDVRSIKSEDIKQFVWDFWTRKQHDKLQLYYKSQKPYQELKYKYMY